MGYLRFTHVILLAAIKSSTATVWEMTITVWEMTMSYISYH